jgi:hypothetical protein
VLVPLELLDLVFAKAHAVHVSETNLVPDAELEPVPEPVPELDVLAVWLPPTPVVTKVPLVAAAVVPAAKVPVAVTWLD